MHSGSFRRRVHRLAEAIKSMRRLVRLISVVPSVCRGGMLGLHPRVSLRGLVRADRLPSVRSRSGSKLTLGLRVRLFRGVEFSLESRTARIEIGPRTFINRGTRLISADRLTIGADCAVSWDVVISDTDFHRISGRSKTSPVIIGNHVWIGARATILKGVTVGDGAVVGAGSVVTSDVPPRAVVAGNPARVVKTDIDWEL